MKLVAIKVAIDLAKTSTDSGLLKDLVDSLTEKYESDFDQTWQPEYKSSLLGAIVGLEVNVSKIRCKYKPSQNRSS
tara:strand:- start:401 stop:628 length:228 start_codon:yes stop_codon:yes gene_type:complete